jgi:transcriptional regulator of acetoin/glycerol metabolism
VQKAVLFCAGDVIDGPGLDLPSSAGVNAAAEVSVVIPEDSRAFTREHIEGLLRKHNGYLKPAIKEAGVSRATFYRKMRRFGVAGRALSKGANP